MRLGIPVALLRVICFALELYTNVTPNRLNKIRTYVGARLDEDPSISNTYICEVGVTGKEMGSGDWYMAVPQTSFELLAYYCGD